MPKVDAKGLNERVSERSLKKLSKLSKLENPSMEPQAVQAGRVVVRTIMDRNCMVDGWMLLVESKSDTE